MNTEHVNAQVPEVLTTQQLHERIIMLAKEREVLAEKAKEVSKQLEEALLVAGVSDTMFQDPETKIVYQVIKPKGTFIAFKEIDYIRTRKSVDEKGDLSMEKAMAAGFDLGELGPKKKAK